MNKWLARVTRGVLIYILILTLIRPGSFSILSLLWVGIIVFILLPVVFLVQLVIYIFKRAISK